MLPAVTTLQALMLFGIQALVLANPLPGSNDRSNKQVNNKNLLDIDLSLGVGVLTGWPEQHQGNNHWGKNNQGKNQGKNQWGKREADEVAIDEEDLVKRQSGDAAEALRLHNAKRSGRQLPALTWDSSLASSAQTWANRLAQQNRMEHSPGNQRPGQGENLAYAWYVPLRDEVRRSMEH